MTSAPPHEGPPVLFFCMQNADDVYNELTTLLHSTPSKVLEIDILPTLPSSSSSSSSCPQIQYSAPDHALGITKVALIQCFVIARTKFFAGKDRLCAGEDETGGKEQDVWRATSVMLLWDPNYSTVINWRKRIMLRSVGGWQGGEGTCEEGISQGDRKREILEQELLFLESLLTSPLPKHTKSSTLWAHRLWLFRTFWLADFVGLWGGEDGGSKRYIQSTRRDYREMDAFSLWERELAVVMKAGERHPRNYYAWNYARELLDRLVNSELCLTVQKHSLAEQTLERTKKWCFMHPRDISGWTFLLWVLELVFTKVGDEKRENTVRVIIWETTGFMRKYDWRGESVEWFLKNAERLAAHQT
ncbi:MAG: hypothetical protein Q9164_007036 [Protoblastenia rupestris]